MESLKYHPELIDTPEKLRFVMNELMEDCGVAYINFKSLVNDLDSEDFENGDEITSSTEVALGSRDDDYILSVTPVVEVVEGKTKCDNLRGFIYLTDTVSSGDTVKYKWGEVPDGILREITDLINVNVDVSVLDAADRVNDLLAGMRNGDIPNEDVMYKREEAPFMTYLGDYKLMSTTGIVPYFENSLYDKSVDTEPLEGHTLECQVDSKRGISIIEDGEFVAENVSPDTILEWKQFAEKYMKLSSAIHEVMRNDALDE